MLEALTEAVRYQPVLGDIYDLEDAPLDEVTVTDGDNSTLAPTQPPIEEPKE